MRGFRSEDEVRKSDLVDLEMVVHQDVSRFRSILVSLYGDQKEAVWLPRNEIEYEMTAPGRATVTLPEWLAIDRKLV